MFALFFIVLPTGVFAESQTIFNSDNKTKNSTFDTNASMLFNWSEGASVDGMLNFTQQQRLGISYVHNIFHL